MPSYHFSAQIIGRTSGRSSVAAAAYRAGERLRDEHNGQEFDFSRRRGIAERQILLPDGAAPWLSDRTRLWNHVEAMEKRKDAQLAREINMALPHELTHAQRVQLVRDFVREQFVSKGMVADIAWHDPVPEKGDDPRNFHAHVMLTLRQGTTDGLNRVKTREWNSDSVMEEWREAWSSHQNRALERAGVRQHVDHRTLEAQRAQALERGDRKTAEGLDRTPELHVGPKARAADRRGREPISKAYERHTARPSGGKWYSSSAVEKRRRPLDYSSIDRGSRAFWNAAIVETNIQRTFGRADKLERQAARVRQREMRAMRILSLSTMPASQRQARGMTITPRQVHLAQRHKALSSILLRDIERLLAELFHVRSLWSRRRRDMTYEKVHQRDVGRAEARPRILLLRMGQGR